MPRIHDVDRDAFSEAEKTTLDNFTSSELRDIQEMAIRLKQIFKAAKERQQQSF